jgi:aspartate 1-decarboxylase
LLRTMLHAKIHRARITNKCLEYSGSITVDPVLLEGAGIFVNEKVLVANLSTGERAETYAIEGRRNSGDICLNGAAARLGEIGDLLIIMAFAEVDDRELAGWEPRVVTVDKNNRPVGKPRAAGKARKA